MAKKQSPIGQLKYAKWLHYPEIQRLIAILCKGGIDTRFVGGCVRDSLIRKSIRDIDMATPLLPQQVIEVLTRNKIKAIPTGIEHGTVTAVLPHFQIQITTLRKDVETDGRKAKVAFTDDWIEDANRRDFTCNALSCNARGEVYDPFTGLADLREGKIAFIGKAEDRIVEDYLRILRFFRFFAHYGTQKLSSKALEACVKHKDNLKKLSRERIRDEFLKLLSAPDPIPALKILDQTGILKIILPEAESLKAIEKLVEYESHFGEVKPLRRLISLAPQKMDFAESFALSKNIDQKIKLYQQQKAPDLISDEQEVQKLLHNYPVEAVRDILFLEAIFNKIPLSDLTDALIQTRFWQAIKFPVSGKDLQNEGIAPGPTMGETLKALEEWWLKQNRTPSKADCLKQLKKMK